MRRSRGLTMMELILVIGMIAMLAAILFPVFARAREKARGQSCLMNLANIALALRTYAQDHEGWYPPTEDDLSALMARYVMAEQVFACPSGRGHWGGSDAIPMGAPANEEIWHPPGPEPAPPDEDPWGPPPPEPEQPSCVPAAPPGPGDVVLAQEEYPGGPHYPEGTIFTSFYYRAGRRHNELPMAPLCADHEPRHNGGANVLFSDGNLRWVHETRWRELGFVTPQEIEVERHPELRERYEYMRGDCCIGGCS